MEIDQNFICNMMEERNIVNNDQKSFNFQTNDLYLALCLWFIALTCNIIFSKRGNFGQLKTEKIHDNIIEQAGAELCQAQSKLTQIGRVVGKKIVESKIFLGQKYISGRKVFLGRKKVLDKQAQNLCIGA